MKTKDRFAEALAFFDQATSTLKAAQKFEDAPVPEDFYSVRQWMVVTGHKCVNAMRRKLQAMEKAGLADTHMGTTNGVATTFYRALPPKK